MKPLLTPGEMAKQIAIPCPNCLPSDEGPAADCESCDGDGEWGFYDLSLAAIRADREAIAKAVEEIRPTSDYDDAWQKGFLFACKLMLAMMRPTNKKGEPPLDDSPTAPLV